MNEATKDTVQATADLLVTSGLKRTLQTTILGFPALRKRLEAEGKPVVVLPQLQEVNDLPCDTGSVRLSLTLYSFMVSFERAHGIMARQDRAVLEADPEFAGLDLSALTPDWNTKQGFYAATETAIRARARWVRNWLRARPERRIVVVSHGDFLRYITKGENDHGAWANVEMREYTFAVEEGEDGDGDGEAWLVPVKEVVEGGEDEPTSSEQVSGA